LRIGPWRIERRDNLMRLRELAEQETERGESKIDFQLRFPARDVTGEFIRPAHTTWGSRRRRQTSSVIDPNGPTRPVSGDDQFDDDHSGE